MIEVILHFKSSHFVRNHDSCDFISNKTSSVLETRKAKERETGKDEMCTIDRNEGKRGISS